LGQFRKQASLAALSNFGGKLPHGFLRNLTAFASCHGGAGFAKGGSELNTSPFAFLPQRKGFFNRFFLAVQAPHLHGVTRECSLIGGKFDFHGLSSFSTEYGNLFRNTNPGRPQLQTLKDKSYGTARNRTPSCTRELVLQLEEKFP
jgi:hypothetical protein